jgi:hypothetical protein
MKYLRPYKIFEDIDEDEKNMTRKLKSLMKKENNYDKEI